jgi:hypothetical protein
VAQAEPERQPDRKAHDFRRERCFVYPLVESVVV